MLSDCSVGCMWQSLHLLICRLVISLNNFFCDRSYWFCFVCTQVRCILIHYFVMFIVIKEAIYCVYYQWDVEANIDVDAMSDAVLMTFDWLHKFCLVILFAGDHFIAHNAKNNLDESNSIDIVTGAIMVSLLTWSANHTGELAILVSLPFWPACHSGQLTILVSQPYWSACQYVFMCLLD